MNWMFEWIERFHYTLSTVQYRTSCVDHKNSLKDTLYSWDFRFTLCFSEITSHFNFEYLRFLIYFCLCLFFFFLLIAFVCWKWFTLANIAKIIQHFSIRQNWLSHFTQNHGIGTGGILQSFIGFLKVFINSTSGLSGWVCSGFTQEDSIILFENYIVKKPADIIM